jgi:hypothetical protein
MPASDHETATQDDSDTTTPDDRAGTARAVRWLAAQTTVVALLAGVVHQLTMSTLLEGGMSYMGADISGIGAAVGLRAVQGFLLVGAGLFACWPVLVFVLRADGDGNGGGMRRAWFLSVAALPPALAGVVLVGATGEQWLLVVPVLVALVVGILLSLVIAVAVAIPWSGESGDGRPFTLALGMAALVAVAFVAGTTVAAPLAGLSETRDVNPGGPPLATFVFEATETADGTRLTITHDGGDRIGADRIHVEGDLAAVPGADQARAGSWNGTTSADDGARVVEPDDAVTVGLASADDCVVRVVYRYRRDAATLDRYDCADAPA